MQVLSGNETVTVLTGAGISTDSGIPDFRGPNGVWTKNPRAERLFTLQHYVADRAVRVEAWRRRLEHEAWTAEPNGGHRALAALERSGVVRTVITQNIDGLHQQAGSTNVIEIHGTLRQSACLSCDDRQPMSETLARVRAGEEDPPCSKCGGIVKSATISFGQALDVDTLQLADNAARNCDVFMAVGTSLTVHPAAGLCDVARMAKARLIVVNAQPTPYDDVADTVIREPIGEFLPRLVGGLQ